MDAIGHHPKQSDVDHIILTYEHKNQIIMRRQNTGVRQFEPKKTDWRKNVCYRVLCLIWSSYHIGETSQWWDEWEFQQQKCKNRNENNSFYMLSEWEQETLLACDSHYSQQRIKESIVIHVFLHKGVKNYENSKKKLHSGMFLFCKNFQIVKFEYNKSLEFNLFCY